MTTIELSESDKQTAQEVVELLDPSQRLFFVTGAGMSADSGLPTYRGVGGLYNSGETEEGMAIEELLSGPVFRRKPELTWKYLGEIAKSAQDATFNRGHEVIAEMEKCFRDVCVLTQNIDGFHLDAGSTNVIEIHGNLHYLVCTHCGFSKSVDRLESISLPPVCDKCQEMMRPDVVLFEEMLQQDDIARLTQQWQSGFDVVISVGTTSVFPYIAEPVIFASEHNLPAIEINPTETVVSRSCSHRIESSASLALDLIWTEFQARPA